MADQQRSEHLSEAQLKAHAVEMWPEVNGWVQGGGRPWAPVPGSRLAEDDAQTKADHASLLARMSLWIGSEHLMTMLAHSVNHYPTVFSMQTLLRTAMVGGAQAVWLLAPEDRAERVANADRLSQESYWNQYMWASDVTTQDPDIVDQQELATVKQNLDTLRGDQKRSELSQLRLVRAAAEHVYSKPPDPDLVNECVAEFRHLSSAAHALPWNLNLRAEKVAVDHAGQTATVYLPSWTQLQGALSESYAFLSIGWKLLEKHGAAPDSSES